MRINRTTFLASLFVLVAFSLAANNIATALAESMAKQAPALAKAVAEGKLPPLEERLPENPNIINLKKMKREAGRYGGTMKMLMARSKDIRMMTVFSYARLVGFDQNFDLQPDILQHVAVDNSRSFTLFLRKGHKWSDGHPFTSEDFRYYWEDVALSDQLSRGGPPREMIVDGELPVFEVIDDLTVRYTWSKPNPWFLPSLAGARPNFIFKPAHYLKQFHEKYANKEELAQKIAAAKKRNWTALHTSRARQYRPENPDLPTLDPWVNQTAPPAERFVFTRNPYFHRVDSDGRQLPYIDKIHMRISSASIIAAKTGAGETDLQARYIRFDDYTFLKQAEQNHPLKVTLWKEGTGSNFALLPNLNTNDEGWQVFFRDARFRRALSLSINRHEINQQFFFGLAKEGANTVMAASPLFREEYFKAYADFDPDRANKMLDEVGLKRKANGMRVLPDGRPAEIIVEYAGGDRESDILELVSEYWQAIGIKLYQRGMQRDNMRRRFHAGDTLMSVWSGLSVGLATPDLPPEELAPASAGQASWAKWGEYTETQGKAGEPIDDPVVLRLAELYGQWRRSESTQDRERIWHDMLKIHASEVFTIGTVNSALQPVVINRRLKNVPTTGIYTFSPTAYFGVYFPDTFWFDEEMSTDSVVAKQ